MGKLTIELPADWEKLDNRFKQAWLDGEFRKARMHEEEFRSWMVTVFSLVTLAVGVVALWLKVLVVNI